MIKGIKNMLLIIIFSLRIGHKISDNKVLIFVFHLCLFDIELEATCWDDFTSSLIIGYSCVVLYGICQLDYMISITL